MVWKEYLDAVLVPIGLLIMLGYHLVLFYRCQKCSENTVIGHEHHNRRIWVKRIMLISDAKDRGFAIAVINGKISASAFLASTSLALSSLVGALMSSSSHKISSSILVYGNAHAYLVSIKYFSLLICFLVAFGSFLQCARRLVHANFLISMPHSGIDVEYMQNVVVRGNFFWTVGMRTIYTGASLLFWIFGPIPMIAASLIIVIVLHVSDSTSSKLRTFDPLEQEMVAKDPEKRV